MLEVVLGPSGGLVLKRLLCPRLPWLGASAEVTGPLEDLVAQPREDWTALADSLRRVATERCAALLSQYAGFSEDAIRQSVDVSLHLLVQDPEAKDLPDETWRVTPFESSMAQGAEDLTDSDLTLDSSDLRLAPYSTAGLTAVPPRTVLVQKTAWVVNDSEISGRQTYCLLHENSEGHVDLPTLNTSTAWVLSQTAPILELELLGRSTPIRHRCSADIVSDLPAPGKALRVHLDIGSSRARMALEFLNDGEVERVTFHVAETDSMLRDLNLPQRLECEASWLKSALGPLARFSIESHGRWLQAVSAVVRTERDIEQSEDLEAEAAKHLLGSQVNLVHLARATLQTLGPVLDELAQLETDHEMQCYNALETYRKRIAQWHKQVAARKDNPLWSIISSDPGQQPTPPPDYEPLGIVPLELRRAVADDGPRVVLDAGARWTSLAVFAEDRVEERHWRCGWSDVEQHEERAAATTRADAVQHAYGPSLRKASKWLGSVLPADTRWVALATGGAMRDPALREHVMQTLAGLPGFTALVDLGWLWTAKAGVTEHGLEAPRLTALLDIANHESGVRDATPSTGAFDAVASLVAAEVSNEPGA